MPIISSVPALNAIVKGVGATFTLDKSQLALVASVAASPYYSVQSNWKNIILVYQSSTGNQPENVYFDATQVSPTGVFDVTLTALNEFLIQSILIEDSQGGFFTVPRSELVVADFDVDMAPVSIALWGTYYGETASTGGGELHRTGVTTGWDNSARSQYALNGDFSFTGSVDVLQVNAETMIGYTKAPMAIAPTGPDFSTAFYIHVTSIVHFSGLDNTAVTVSGFAPNVGTRSFSIVRTAGVITAKINGQTIFTDNFAGAVYVGASVYQDGYTDITSALLSE